jgi:hypothetical protein
MLVVFRLSFVALIILLRNDLRLTIIPHGEKNREKNGFLGRQVDRIGLEIAHQSGRSAMAGCHAYPQFPSG